MTPSILQSGANGSTITPHSKSQLKTTDEGTVQGLFLKHKPDGTTCLCAVVKGRTKTTVVDPWNVDYLPHAVYKSKVKPTLQRLDISRATYRKLKDAYVDESSLQDCVIKMDDSDLTKLLV